MNPIDEELFGKLTEQKVLGDRITSNCGVVKNEHIPTKEVLEKIEHDYGQFIENNLELQQNEKLEKTDYGKIKYWESIEKLYREMHQALAEKTPLPAEDDHPRTRLHQKMVAEKQKLDAERLLKEPEKQYPTFHLPSFEIECKYTESLKELRSYLEEEKFNVAGKDKFALESMRRNIRLRYEYVIDRLNYTEINYEAKLIKRQVDDRYFEFVDLITERIKNESQSAAPKLQEIKIPYFEGDKSAWSSFFDLFNNLIHNNRHFSQVEKFFRLKTLVKGEAAKLIQHLNIAENNYEVALEMLKNRFENKRLLFSTLVDRLLDQPEINSEVPSSIRQLMDTTNECVRSIEAMGLTINEAKPFIARVVLRKLDSEATRQYEFTIKRSKEIQTLDDVLQFLEQMSQAQEAMKSKRFYGNSYQRMNKHPSQPTVDIICVYCKGKSHTIYTCQKFGQLKVSERSAWVTKTKSCSLCLFHTTDKQCLRTGSKCKKCNKSHNTLLHIGNEKTTTNSSGKTYVTTEESCATVLLATAQVRVKSLHGEDIILRALVDQGSQKSTISEEAAQWLQLPRMRSKTELYGLGGTLVGVSKSKMHLQIRPRIHNDALLDLEALVLPALTTAQPDESFNYDISKWDNYCLADPNFNKCSRIDIVLGADIYHEILEEGMRKVDKLTGQSTKLGWMISGTLQKSTTKEKVCTAATTVLERFWELEEVPETINEEEDDCVQFFESTTKLNEDNRFVVKLPFYENHELGDSRKQAMARFLQLEKRLEKDPSLKQQYVSFMEEYLEMGHMKETMPYSGKYYLPHQPVLREDSLTTKLRVVFDASAKTSNHRSLNDVLKVGPKLQKDIFDIIIKWRLWRFVVSADVAKMYRQILLQDDDQAFQHILWRESKYKPIKEFKLTTVTYGTASAPFLAKKALAEIGTDCSNDEALQNVILEDFYMDDLMTGADSKEDCNKMRIKLTQQLDKFKFPLRKWISNESEILDAIPNTGNLEVVSIDGDEAIKTLGLQWRPCKDTFTFLWNANKDDKKITKRRALSTLARIFDPMGWLTPFTTCVKLFIQKLWLMQSDWDVPLEENLQNEWQIIIKSMSFLQTISIPRWYGTCLGSSLEVHAFADASQKAYAAVVYFKIDGTLKLVAGKGKVNPVKNRKTLPKLELCAAHLLSKLVSRILSTIQRQVNIIAWSDSTIALAWILNNKSKDRFIRTRVDEIKANLPNAIWKHVDTKSNPADAASRGVTADKINVMWWNGPSWLKEDSASWPPQHFISSHLTTHVKTEEDWLGDLSKKYSSFRKLERIIAYVRRFAGKLRGKTYFRWLSTEELESANQIITTQHQKEHFFAEINSLRKNQEVTTRSRIANLHPFIDDKGVLRVGGRLANSDLPYSHKHPILLDKSWLAEVIVEEVHLNTLHGGNNLVASQLNRKYWILGAKNTIKKVIRRCVVCTRYKKAVADQLMGDLPRMRVSVSHPFTHTGVDYAGPIQMRCSKGRGQRSFKGYIAVFVCMTTRAIHLEAVSDLTSEGFLAALRRFFARRGKAKCLYSDNGTNFIGAARKLDADFLKAIKNNKSLCPILEEERIQWRFIPPASPHFGGMWEAGVKSAKYHLKRVIGESTLTYEEMATLLAKIEAVLNSRPLCLTSNTEYAEVLTPGHFLIGQPLLGDAEAVDDNGVSSLNRWKLISKMKRDFWAKWKDEYLVTLQKRNKWQQEQPNLKENQIVIVKDEATAPAKWPMGRIIETHQGKYGKVRVVTLKMQNGELKRPIHKLCPLFTEKEDQPVKEEVTKASCNMTLYSRDNRQRLNSTIIIALILLICNSVRGMSILKPGTVRELGNSTIIYLDKVGTLNRVTSSWNLVAYYDMRAYFATVNHLKDVFNECAVLCGKLGEFEDQCNVVISSLDNRLKDILENDQLFQHNTNSRRKRAPFEFVGSFYHMLFGTMDADDRREMEENMRNLFENQSNMKHLVEKQTSVVESTVNILKKTSEDINSQFKYIREKVNNMTERLSYGYIVFKETARFSMMSLQLEGIIYEAERIQTQVIGLLMDINHGKINPKLIKPHILQGEILKIKENLSSKLRLPGGPDKDTLQAVYRLMTARGIFMDEKLIINIQIPLLETMTSVIFHIIPLPIRKDGSKMLAILRDQLVVYNYEFDSYHLISQPALNRCQLDGTEEYLCKGNWAWEDANDESCELASLKPSNQFHCSFKEVNSKDVWLELNDRSSWLFRTFEQLTAHILCSKQAEQVLQLPLQGVLKLEAGCSARIGRTNLVAPHDIRAEVEGQFKAIWLKEAKDMEIIRPMNEVMINYTAEVNDLQKQLKAIRTENVELKSLNWHHECLRLKIIERLLKEGSSAEEPINIPLSDYSSDEGSSSSSDNEGKGCSSKDFSDLEGPCCHPLKAPPCSPELDIEARKPHKLKLRCKSLHRRKKDERLLLDLPTTDPGSDLVFSTDDEYVIDSNGIQCYGTMPRNIRRGLMQSELQRRYIEEMGDGQRNMPPELIITSPSNKTKHPSIKILLKPSAKRYVPPKSAELPMIGGPARRTSSWHNLNTASQSPVTPQWYTVNMPKQSPTPSAKPVMKSKCIAKKEQLTKEDLDIKLSLKKKIWTGIQPDDAPQGVDRSRPLSWAPPQPIKANAKKSTEHNATLQPGPSCSVNSRRLENEAFLTACSQKLLEWQNMTNNDEDTPRSQKIKLPVALMMPEINDDHTMRIFKHLSNIKKSPKPKTDNENKSRQNRNIITKVTETTNFITKITKTKSRSSFSTSHRSTHKQNGGGGVVVGLTQHKLQGRNATKFKPVGIVATAAVQPTTNAKIKTKKQKSSHTKLSSLPDTMAPLKINGTNHLAAGGADVRPATSGGIVIASTATTIVRKVKSKLKKKKSSSNSQNATASSSTVSANASVTLTTIYSNSATSGAGNRTS